MSLRLLHLSDTHFGTEQSRVADGLLQLIDGRGLDLAILSGDITQRARRAEFAAAASYLDCLEMPVLALPGNHDIPLFNLVSRLVTPYGNYFRALQTALMPEKETSELLALGVNTTRWYRHTDGEISSEQIAQVSARLRRASPRQLRIVVTHQPVHTTVQRDEHNRLRGHAEAIRAWSAAGADLILGGHIHLPFACDLRTAYPDLPRATWAVQAGTAVSRRVRFEAPNSVNILHYDADATVRRCDLERWDFDAARDAFVLHSRTEMPLESAAT